MVRKVENILQRMMRIKFFRAFNMKQQYSLVLVMEERIFMAEEKIITQGATGYVTDATVFSIYMYFTDFLYRQLSCR
jgi:hypothetical protein